MPPRDARSRGGQRFYEWGPSRERFWSVTTILSGGVPKPALLPWGIREVAIGAADLADQLPALVAHDREAAIAMLKGLPYAKRDRAANLGTEVHEAAEAYALGRPMPPWAPHVRPFMLQFLDFLAACEPVYEMTEASVYNRSQAYAGTLDAIAVMPTLDGRRFLLDAKTGKSIYPEVGLQCAAYRYAEFIGAPDGTEQPMPAVDAAAALHLTADGWRLIEVRADEEVFASFLYAREVFRFQQDLSKTVIGAVLAEGAAGLDEPAPVMEVVP